MLGFTLLFFKNRGAILRLIVIDNNPIRRFFGQHTDFPRAYNQRSGKIHKPF